MTRPIGYVVVAALAFYAGWAFAVHDRHDHRRPGGWITAPIMGGL